MHELVLQKNKGPLPRIPVFLHGFTTTPLPGPVFLSSSSCPAPSPSPSASPPHSPFPAPSPCFFLLQLARDGGNHMRLATKANRKLTKGGVQKETETEKERGTQKERERQRHGGYPDAHSFALSCSRQSIPSGFAYKQQAPPRDTPPHTPPKAKLPNPSNECPILTINELISGINR